MGNEQGKDIPEVEASEVTNGTAEGAAAPTENTNSNKLSLFTAGTGSFMNNTLRKLSNAATEQLNETGIGKRKTSDVDVKEGEVPPQEGAEPNAKPVLEGETNDGEQSGRRTVGQERFQYKLKQTVVALNALRGTGDECHAFVVTNAAGLRLAGYHWKPRALKIGGKKVRMPGGPRAVVFVLHGAGEHCQWYDVIAKPLNAQGITVCAHDHVGHGLSEGDRVHVNDFNEYVCDVVQHLDIIHKKYPESPIFLLGHSMGGTIAIKTVLDHKDLPVKGVILIAPAIMPNPETVTPIKIFLAKVAAKLSPQLQVAPIKPEWICRDPAIVKKYVDDPLVWHGGLKAQWAMTFMETLRDIQPRLPVFTLPYLLMHGTEDKLCEISGSDLFDKTSSSKDKTYKKYEKAFHQLHNEPEGVGAECLQEITDWVNKRI